MNSEVSTQATPLARWSLILSILGFFIIGPFGLIPAVICGHLANSRIKNSSGSISGAGLAKNGLVIGYMGIILQLIVFPLILYPRIIEIRDKAIRTKCSMNLRIINLAARQYSEENKGVFPSDIQSLAKYIEDPRVLVCPKTNHQPGNMSEIAKWSDYILVPDRKFGGGEDNVLAYSKPECYQGTGGNITFMDLTTRWCPLEEYNRLISKIKR